MTMPTRSGPQPHGQQHGAPIGTRLVSLS